MGKRQKQEQTFPPQLGRTELCLSHSLGRNSTVPCRQWDMGQAKVSQGREGAELDVENWGSSRELHPQKHGVRNRLPEETQMGSAVRGVSTAPLLVAPERLAEKAPPCFHGQQWTGESSPGPAWGWSRASLSWNTAQPTAPAHRLGQLSRTCRGHTAVPKAQQGYKGVSRTWL